MTLLIVMFQTVVRSYQQFIRSRNFCLTYTPIYSAHLQIFKSSRVLSRSS